MENPLNFIANKDIRVIETPFRHIVIDNFFAPAFYQDLSNTFRNILAKGLYETDEKDRFHRFKKYDAYFWILNQKLEHPLSFFYSREWDDLVSNTFNISSSHDTIASFHHHKIDSDSGWVHNDYSLCSFREDRLPNGVNPWYYQCVYEDDSPDQQPDTLKRMRAVVLMLYLENDEQWSEGDGGETGLYGSENPADVLKKVEPRNNRLLAFEISPKSFHGFLRNKKSPRNSLIQWFHQEPSSMFRKYGAFRPVKW